MKGGPCQSQQNNAIFSHIKIKTAPGCYDGELPKWKNCTLKPIKAPFGSHIDSTLTQKEYNKMIGNVVSTSNLMLSVFPDPLHWTRKI